MDVLIAIALMLAKPVRMERADPAPNVARPSAPNPNYPQRSWQVGRFKEIPTR